MRIQKAIKEVQCLEFLTTFKLGSIFVNQTFFCELRIYIMGLLIKFLEANKLAFY